MDDEQTASTADNRQQAALAQMREILTPVFEEAKQARRRGRPPGKGSDLPAGQGVPDHLRKKRSKRGPKTAAGRAAVAANAITHGLTSRQVVIPGVEDPEEAAAFRQSLIDDRAPVGAVEEALCDRIAELFWRLRRVAPYEAELVSIARDSVDADYAALHKWNYDGPPEEYLRAANEAAEEVAASIGLTGDPHRRLSEEAGHEFAAVLVDEGEDEDLANQPLPGFEDGVYGHPEDGWSIGLMSVAIRGIAAHLEKDVTDFAMLLHERLRTRIESRGKQITTFLLQKNIMSRERLMPPPQQLINLSKWEAHLGRQLAQSLTQLESLQARRNGRPIPTHLVHFSSGG